MKRDITSQLSALPGKQQLLFKHQGLIDHLSPNSFLSFHLHVLASLGKWGRETENGAGESPQLPPLTSLPSSFNCLSSLEGSSVPMTQAGMASSHSRCRQSMALSTQKASQSYCLLLPPEKQAASSRATDRWCGEHRPAWGSQGR